MARVNVGVNPKYLADQHLVAESVEITMIIGSLRKNNFQIKSPVPVKFNLGKGHMNFFKTKIMYLKRRLEEVNKEMVERGFKPGTKIDLRKIPSKFKNDWSPNMIDSNIIRKRINNKVNNKVNKFWRRRREKIDNNILSESIKKGELYFV